MIRVALLSKWHVHAEGYANEFASLPYVQIAAVWDEDPTRGKEWAEEFHCPFEEDLAKLLQRDDIDAVSVCTPTAMHDDILCACAEAKKAIFVEKVLSITPDGAERIAASVRQNEVPFCISLRRRTEGRILHAKKLVDKGAVGQITYLRVRDAHDGASSGWLPQAFFSKKDCGGGAMIDLGAHPMYLSLYFLGEPQEVTSLFTEVSGCGVDDNCVSLLKYPNGAIAVSETSFVAKRCPFSLEINGTKGSLLLGDAVEGIRLQNEAGVTYIKEGEMTPSLPMPVALFSNAVEQHLPIPFTVDEGVRLTRLMDAAYRSAAQGRTVAYEVR
jgi:1,5-anhydro-D-fructose reductase (1,5-anhydro-D-mannitol-forming)